MTISKRFARWGLGRRSTQESRLTCLSISPESEWDHARDRFLFDSRDYERPELNEIKQWLIGHGFLVNDYDYIDKWLPHWEDQAVDIRYG